KPRRRSPSNCTAAAPPAESHESSHYFSRPLRTSSKKKVLRAGGLRSRKNKNESLLGRRGLRGGGWRLRRRCRRLRICGARFYSGKHGTGRSWGRCAPHGKNRK